MFEYYQKNRGALDMLRAPIFEEKVVDLIFKDAEIADKEVSLEELTKEDDDFELKGAKKKPSKKKADDGEEKPAAKKKAKKDE